ncbi:MAG: PilZ domain-containing protein [Chloroflexota bacterium]
MSVSDLSFLRPPCRLQILWNTNSGEQAAYSGHLRSVADEQLSVHLLGYGLVPSALRTGEAVAVHVPVAGGIYEIPSQVLSEDISGDLLITVTGDVKQLDRRRYPRLRVSMAATTAFLPAHPPHPPTPITVRITELSGGGAKLESFSPLDPGQIIQIMVPIPGHSPIFPSGSVLECLRVARHQTGTESERHIIRVEFTGVLSGERRILHRYVAQERERAPELVPNG